MRFEGEEAPEQRYGFLFLNVDAVSMTLNGL